MPPSHYNSNNISEMLSLYRYYSKSLLNLQVIH